MSKMQIKKILTVLGGVVSIIFLGMLVNGYFNILLFLTSVGLVGANACVKKDDKKNNDVNCIEKGECVEGLKITCPLLGKNNVKNKVKVRVRRKD